MIGPEDQPYSDGDRYLPAHYRSMAELVKAVGEDTAEKIKTLIKDLIDDERRNG